MMCKKRPLTREEYSAVLKSESRGVLSAQSGGGSDGGWCFFVRSTCAAGETARGSLYKVIVKNARNVKSCRILSKNAKKCQKVVDFLKFNSKFA